MERDTLVVENAPIEEASNVQETQQPLPEVNNSSHLEGVLKEPFVGSRTTILLMVMLLLMALA